MTQKGKGNGNAMREAVGDGTHPADRFHVIVGPLLEDNADTVVDSRILSNMEKCAMGGFNALGNKILNIIINFSMGSLVTDSLSEYRALYGKKFKQLVLYSNSFGIEVEITVDAIAQGYRILEFPIDYGFGKGSKTKLNPSRNGVKISRSLLLILMNVNPLRFFGVISLGFYIAGLHSAYLVLREKYIVGDITFIPAVVFISLLFVTATISLVVGLLSELMVRSRRNIEYPINKRLGLIIRQVVRNVPH